MGGPELGHTMHRTGNARSSGPSGGALRHLGDILAVPGVGYRLTVPEAAPV